MAANKQSARRVRSQSIAKKLNASLNRKRFFRAVVADIVFASLILACWCLTNEATSGGHFTNVHERGFITSVDFDFGENIGTTARGIGGFFRRPSFHTLGSAVRSLFDGVSYTFTVADANKIESESADMTGNGDAAENYGEDVRDGLRVVVKDASGILSGLTLGLVFFLGIGSIEAICRVIFGGDEIKRYLQPIDDIALEAERISNEAARRVTSEHEVLEQYRAVQDDGDISRDDIDNLAGVISKIDDSGARIDVHQSELGGLEAAVNNMLKRLEESKQKQIRFVDDASHELRTPISVIQGYVNMLDRWGKDDPKIRDEAIEAIKNESEHMKTLIDQLLFLARGEMDRHVLDKKPIDARIIVDEIYDESVMLDKDHEYRVLASSTEFGGENEDSYTVLGDMAMLKQAVRILRDNAVKYTPDGGTIKFRVYLRSDGKVCIEVTDTGIGIPEDELPRIFDRFYRGSNARADNTSGSGLGLSIALWIIEEHSGRIEAISSTDIGTKMTVILDRCTE